MPIRVVPQFTDQVPVDDDLRMFLWDHPEGKAPLEKLLVRTFTYGNYDQLKRVARAYVNEARVVAERYDTIPRGARYWVRQWAA